MTDEEWAEWELLPPYTPTEVGDILAPMYQVIGGEMLWPFAEWAAVYPPLGPSHRIGEAYPGEDFHARRRKTPRPIGCGCLNPGLRLILACTKCSSHEYLETY